MGSRKGGEKWYGNGLFALGISYNPPILPLPCCFSVPQFIIFPLSLCSSFVSSPLFLCSTTYPTPFSLRSRRGEGGIVAKVRYRCRRGDTGVARITVTAAGGWKRSPSHPFRCFERHATSRPSSLWIPSNESESFEDRRASRMPSRINTEFVPFVFIILCDGKNLVSSLSNSNRVNYFWWIGG